MKQFQGIWMPGSEIELIDWMSKHGQMIDGKGTYQYAKFQGAMEYCKSFRTCIDQGSHIGLWTMHLAKRFDTVHCFEPVAALRECWVKNLADITPPPTLYHFALGKESGRVYMASNTAACGDSWIDTIGAERRHIYGAVAERIDHSVEMRTLDSFEFIDVDFMKVDAEGYEENILRGAADTIRKWRPTIIVEQKRDMACKFGLEPQGALQYLREAHDYRIVREMGGDFILQPC